MASHREFSSHPSNISAPSTCESYSNIGFSLFYFLGKNCVCFRTEIFRKYPRQATLKNQQAMKRILLFADSHALAFGIEMI